MNELYRGIVRGNRVEMEDEVLLPDGTRVTVIPDGSPHEANPLSDWLREARLLRARLALTSDSVGIVQQIRQERAGR